MQYKKQEIIEKIEDYINGYVDTNGTTPTVRDIAAGIGICKASVADYLKTMAERGIISYDGHRKPVTRRMQSDINNTVRSPLIKNGVPVVGSIACGSPVDAEEYVEDTYRLPMALFGAGPLYMLRANGESMIEAGIDDGDLVVVRQQQTAEAGQIVVALIDGATTLKRFYPEPEKHRIRLQPENSSMEPMYFDSIEIQGVAVKIIKDVN